MILYESGSVKGQASGTNITINDTSNDRKLRFNKYYGDTQQSGTPTPSSPQSINVVTGNNTITIANDDNTQTQSYSLNLGTTELCKIGDYQDNIFKSSGKNILPTSASDWEQGSISSGSTGGNLSNTKRIRTINYYPIQSGIDYHISVQNTKYTFLNMCLYDSDYAFLGGYYETVSNAISGATNLTINIPTSTYSNVAYMRVTMRNADNTSNVTANEIEIAKPMIEKGNQSTSFEPYGNYWYIEKKIGKVVLNGSESNWTYDSATTTPTPRTVMSNSSLISFLNSNYYSSYFIQNSTTSNRIVLQTANNRLYLSLENSISGVTSSDTNAQKVGKIKTWLSTHNADLYYVLASPTYTKFEGDLLEQIEALTNATTYDNQTNIVQTNTGLPLYVDIDYIQPLDFSRNGLGYLPNVLNAKVVDEINGEYSLTFEYPMSEPMANELVEDRIVKCKVSDGTNQCFVIKTIQKDFDKMVVYCTHLFYLLNDDFLEDTYPQNLSPKPFLDWLLSRANYQLPFTTTSDISTTNTARYIRKNVVESILGDIDNSMYNLWGLELKRDNWNIGLKARLGADKGEKLIFGKNITGVNVNIDTTGVYTRIMPIGFDGLLLPEKYVDADNIDDYPYPRICLYEFPDIIYDPEQEGAYHNLEDAYQALRDAVNELYANGINKPLINIQVDWLELSKTEEYKQYSALERVDLGDTLTCNLLGMDYQTRVIKTTYNPLTDRIDKFEIGTFQPNIATQMNKVEFDVSQINPTSILEQAQENATSLITQAMGGYVYKTNSELYIMDNEDPNQAVKVWRWNINGLGYSSTGINGTYGLAMTMDGSIVADFITTGQLSANVINASTIIGVINGNTSQLKLDADQIDLNATDVLNILAGNQIDLTTKNISINSTNFSVDTGGNMSCNNANITGGYLTLTDDPDTQDDRLIINKKNSTELTTITSEYVLTKKAQSDDYNYSQMSLDSGLAHGVGTDSNNFKSSEMNQDTIILTKRENGTTTRSNYRSDGATINGDVTIGGDLTVNGIIKGLNIPYCLYYSRDFTHTCSAWVNTQVNFTSGTTSWATNSDDFTLNGNIIRTNFNGVVLVMRQITHQHNGELDINDELGAKVGLGYNNNSMSIVGVSSGDYIRFEITTGATSVPIWNVRLIVIRLS